MARPTPLINVMERAARKAARPLMRDYGEIDRLQTSLRGPGDFADKATRRTAEILGEELGKARPGFGLLVAGASAGTDGDERWVVDPIDGAANFLHGIPHFAITIAAERDGEPVAAVVYEPLRNELFWAERGAGAYMNRYRLRASERGRLEDALLATGVPPDGGADRESFAATLRAVAGRGAGVRRFGAAALDLAGVAAGRLEGFWGVGLAPWRVAAGVALVREAGGMVGEIGGRAGMLRGGSIVATNPRLYDDVRKLLADAVRNDGPAVTE